MKTTKKHFELFKAEFLEWISFFELTHWRFVFEHKDVEGVYAAVHTNPTDCVARVQFTQTWDTCRDLNEKEIAETALHEACHVLTAKLDSVAARRIVSEEELTNASEETTRKIASIIQKLME